MTDLDFFYLNNIQKGLINLARLEIYTDLETIHE